MSWNVNTNGIQHNPTLSISCKAEGLIFFFCDPNTHKLYQKSSWVACQRTRNWDKKIQKWSKLHTKEIISRAEEKCQCFIVEQFHMTYRGRVYFSLYCLTYLKVNKGTKFCFYSVDAISPLS